MNVFVCVWCLFEGLWCVFQHETVEGYRRYFNQIVGWVTSRHLLEIRRWVFFFFFYEKVWAQNSLQVFRGGGSHIKRHAGSGDQSLHGRAVEHGPVENHRRSPHALGERFGGGRGLSFCDWKLLSVGERGGLTSLFGAQESGCELQPQVICIIPQWFTTDWACKHTLSPDTLEYSHLICCYCCNLSSLGPTDLSIRSRWKERLTGKYFNYHSKRSVCKINWPPLASWPVRLRLTHPSRSFC